MGHVPSNTLYALVLYRDERQDLHHAPFQCFLKHLRQRYAAPALSTNTGMVSWDGFPIDEILAAGLMTVFTMVANKKLGNEFASSLQRQEVLQIVEPVLNIGMLLVHGSSKQAAEAFIHDVVGKVEQAMASGYRPGMKVPASVWKSSDVEAVVAFMCAQEQEEDHCDSLIAFWQLPVALFFTPMIKAALDFESEYSRRAKELQLGTKVSHRGVKVDISDRFSPSYFYGSEANLLAPARLQKDQPDTTHRSESQYLSRIEELRALVEELEELAQLIQALPMDLSIYPASVLDVYDTDLGHRVIRTIDGPKMVIDAWVKTQMLLELAGERKDTWLTPVTFAQGAELLPHLTVREVRERMETRLARMGVEESVIRALQPYLFERARTLKEKGTKLGVYLHETLFIEIPLDVFEMDAKEALDVAAGDERWARALAVMEDAERLQFLQMLRDLIDWHSLNDAGLDYLLQSSCLLPPRMIAEVLPRLNESIDVKTTVDWLLERDATLVQVLVDNGSLEMTRQMVIDHGESFDRGRLETWVKAEFSKENFEGRVRSIVVACNALSSDRVRAIILRAPNRFEFVNSFISLLANHSDREREGVEIAERNAFIDRLGSVLWCKCILALNARDRLGVYHTDVPTQEDGGHIGPWEEEETFMHSTMITLVGERVSVWISQIGELEAYAWMCRDSDPKLEQREVKEYREERDAYYALPLS